MRNRGGHKKVGKNILREIKSEKAENKKPEKIKKQSQEKIKKNKSEKSE
jgi:hypothetical protein